MRNCPGGLEETAPDRATVGQKRPGHNIILLNSIPKSALGNLRMMFPREHYTLSRGVWQHLPAVGRRISRRAGCTHNASVGPFLISILQNSEFPRSRKASAARPYARVIPPRMRRRAKSLAHSQIE